MILGTLNRFALVEKSLSPVGLWCVEVVCEEINSFSFHIGISQKNHTVDCLEFYKSPQDEVQNGF